MGSAAFEFEIADDACGGGVLALESVGADELVYGFHAEVDGVAYF